MYSILTPYDDDDDIWSVNAMSQTISIMCVPLLTGALFTSQVVMCVLGEEALVLYSMTLLCVIWNIVKKHTIGKYNSI